MTDRPATTARGRDRVGLGQVMSDRYRLDRRLARGGVGEVWQSWDARLGREVAIKILREEFSNNPEYLHRFRIEARTVASLDHRGIAAVHDYGEEGVGGDRLAYLVMELVRGEPLSGRIARGPLTVLETLDVLEQAARALHAAHERGFVHRDVKPGNILLRTDGRVKLTDFGIATAVDSVPLTRPGTVLGTATYLAPEQARGLRATPASDVYSLGVVGYECLVGHPPFRASNAVKVATMHVDSAAPALPGTIPKEVRELIHAALIKDPSHRHADGATFADALALARRGLLPIEPAMRSVDAGDRSASTRSAHRVDLSQGPPAEVVLPTPSGRAQLDEYDDAYYADEHGVGNSPLAVPPPGRRGRPLGPADIEELDPSMTEALTRVDVGSMMVPIPLGADLKLEPAEGGRSEAVHLMLPEGRIAVSALAAPRSSGLWLDLADEIEESLRGGGAQVRGATGDWGRELHAHTANAWSVFLGAEGPRWTVYGVATGARDTIEALDVELRRVMRGIIVIRGTLPYPPRTVLPLSLATDVEQQKKHQRATITVSVPPDQMPGASANPPPVQSS